jgi:alkaline phosphatase
MKKLLFLLFSFSGLLGQTPYDYSTSNAHSHNDYMQLVPFKTAYLQGFGSVEADIFLVNDTLFVAHEREEIAQHRTIESLYLEPIKYYFHKNGGSIYKDKNKGLQLMIDLKTGGNTLHALSKVLEKYKEVLYPAGNVKVVISGSTPKPSEFKNYPEFIFFDGRPEISYSTEELKKVGLISQSLRNYTLWNGKEVPTEKDRAAIKKVVNDAHALGKPFRFWANTDEINAWKVLMNFGVDYINTDKVEELGTYLSGRKKAEYKNTTFHEPYQPSYKNNDSFKNVKNVILLIGDGMGLAQLNAGLVANKGVLNISKMLNIGFSQTAPTDNFITDSAAGANAMATGKKTHNRGIGIDSLGNPVQAIPALLKPLGIKSAIISSGDITDATPAAFYAHRTDRSMQKEIATDYVKNPVEILIGGGASHFEGIFTELEKQRIAVHHDWSDLKSIEKGPFVLLNGAITNSVLNGRGNESIEAFRKSVEILKSDFFIIAEGAQIDWGGHGNNTATIVTEMLDFDKLVGEALKFADSNGETLVIVTADHETGGLSLMDGSSKTGYIDGHYSTSAHTGIMVPVFAYGPHSLDFRGVYQNTAIFEKIMKVLKK